MQHHELRAVYQNGMPLPHPRCERPAFSPAHLCTPPHTHGSPCSIQPLAAPYAIHPPARPGPIHRHDKIRTRGIWTRRFHTRPVRDVSEQFAPPSSPAASAPSSPLAHLCTPPQVHTPVLHPPARHNLRYPPASPAMPYPPSRQDTAANPGFESNYPPRQPPLPPSRRRSHDASPRRCAAPRS